MPDDNRTTDEIERNIEDERAQLGQTLNSLQDKLTFENVSQEFSNQLRAYGSGMLRDVSDRVMVNASSNPMAAIVAGAGLAWLALGSGTRQQEHRDVRGGADRRPVYAERYNEPVAPNGRVGYGQPRTRDIHERVEEAREMARQKLEQLQADASRLRERITEGTDELSEEARSRVLKAREAAVDAAEEAARQARYGVRKAKETVSDNPMIVGGVALAIGAAVAAALAVRRSEDDERMDRDRLFAEADRVMAEERRKAGLPARPERLARGTAPVPAAPAQPVALSDDV